MPHMQIIIVTTTATCYLNIYGALCPGLHHVGRGHVLRVSVRLQLACGSGPGADAGARVVRRGLL
jgi:hypothetical protein